MDFYSIGEFAKLIGKTEQTLRNWDKNDILKPHHTTKSGFRYYSSEQVNEFFNTNKNETEKKIIGYCRVDTSDDVQQLVNQILEIGQYMSSKDYKHIVISDIGLPNDFTREGFKELMTMLVNFKVSKIVVTNNDIFSSANQDLIKLICDICDVQLEVINEK